MFAPRGSASFIKALPTWIRQKLWIPDLISKEIKDFKGKLLFSEHHESHAASAFSPRLLKKLPFGFGWSRRMGYFILWHR